MHSPLRSRRALIARRDCEWMLSQIKHQQNQLRLKRRLLIDLQISKSERKELESSYLPESLLREDDMFYETVKTSIERSLRGNTVEEVHDVNGDNTNLFANVSIRRIVLSSIDELSNNGLHNVSLLLMGGDAKFQKTRSVMKRIVRQHIAKVFQNRDRNSNQMEISTQLLQLMKDPHNFREDSKMFFTLKLQFQFAACTKILENLEDLPVQTLIAMHRKLKGVQVYVPQLSPRQSGCTRAKLSRQIRSTSKTMLTGFGRGDELPELLKKALTVANLSLKLGLCDEDFTMTDFHEYSPEIKLLQNEIIKGIWLLHSEKVIRTPELKRLQHLLDPHTELSSRQLRAAIRYLLTEYLFECGDMDIIPDSLFQSLAVLDKDSLNTLTRNTKEEIEKDIECVLSLSAQIKQIVLDSLPDKEFEKDYTNAYMEELEESCNSADSSEVDLGGQDQHSECRSSRSCKSHSYMESTAESSMPIYCEAVTFPTNLNVSSPTISPNQHQNSDSCERPKTKHFIEVAHGTSASSQLMNGDLNEINGLECNTAPVSKNVPDVFINSMHSERSTHGNEYLVIQDVCDETSMLAYNVIGHMLDEFAKIEGSDLDYSHSLYLKGHCATCKDPQATKEKSTSKEDGDDFVLVRVVKQLIPSLSNSRIERLRELMG